MTAPKEQEEIQRYEIGVHCGMYCMGGMATLTETDYPADDDVVKITDHLRHLKLAQIAVLENVYSEDHPDEVCENIEYKIAALRKELGG